MESQKSARKQIDQIAAKMKLFACDIVVILVWEEMGCPKDCES